MLRSGPQNVALLRHAWTTASIPGDDVFGLSPRQAYCLGIIELLLKFGISFAALAIDTPPDCGIISAPAAI